MRTQTVMRLFTRWWSTTNGQDHSDAGERETSQRVCAQKSKCDLHPNTKRNMTPLTSVCAFNGMHQKVHMIQRYDPRMCLPLSNQNRTGSTNSTAKSDMQQAYVYACVRLNIYTRDLLAHAMRSQPHHILTEGTCIYTCNQQGTVGHMILYTVQCTACSPMCCWESQASLIGCIPYRTLYSIFAWKIVVDGSVQGTANFHG